MLGRVYPDGLRRLNVGGKLLTNQLMNTVSKRQWNVMDEFQVVNEMKEQMCFVSMEFEKEMKKALPFWVPQRKEKIRCSLRQEWVLPNYQTYQHGFVKTEDVILDGSIQVEDILPGILYLQE